MTNEIVLDRGVEVDAAAAREPGYVWRKLSYYGFMGVLLGVPVGALVAYGVALWA